MKNKLIILLIIIFSSFYFFGEDLLTKYIDEAKGYHIIKNYEKAYSRIKFALRIYKTEKAIPKEVRELAENIYFDYITELMQKNDQTTLNEIYKNDPKYNYVLKNSVKLQNLIKNYEQEEKDKKLEEGILKKVEEEKRKNEELEALKKAKEEEYQKEIEKVKAKYDSMINAKIRENKIKDDEIQKIRDKEREELFKLQEEYEKERKEFYIKSKEDFNKFVNNVLLAINKNSSDTVRLIIYVVILLIIVFGIVFLCIIIINVFLLKTSHKQQQKYLEYTIRAIQQSHNNLFSIPMITPNIDTNLMIDSPEIKTLPGPTSEHSDKNIEQIFRIIESCKLYAKEIDEATHRKNCSKNVAELVYKISKYLEYDEYDAMTYYAVGLIYDIGFLNIDQTILDKTEINEKEFDIIKTHTTLGLNMIHFIDNDLKPIFQEGILKHHENLDGTGYPKGINKNDIPYIARVIRVVESFISLISKRRYKKIMDVEQAVNELYKSKKKYDKKIIDALNNII